MLSAGQLAFKVRRRINYEASKGHPFARLRGGLNRFVYKKSLPLLVRRPVRQNKRIALTAYSLSCERDVPEQAASLYSFLRHVGIPDRFVVISDGSHSPASLDLLRRIHPCVEVTPWSEIASPNLPPPVAAYAAIHALGKKLAALLSLRIESPVLYVDSDVLFFAGAGGSVAGLLTDQDVWYLPDVGAYLDERLLKSPDEMHDPVNSGFMVLNRPLNWASALERLCRMDQEGSFYTEQTTVHLAMHASQAKPLPKDKFIMAVDDRFAYAEPYGGRGIALRHYVGTVRHKFWSRLAWVWNE